MTETTENEAFFAVRIFVRGEQDGYRFLMWGTHSIPTDGLGGMVFSTTMAEPAEGAFFCKLENGWLLVAGTGKYSPVRHTFLDDSQKSDENAASILKLGVPVLTIEEGNARVRKDGVTIYSVTGDEKRRIAATESYEAWQAERAEKKSRKDFENKLRKVDVINRPKAPRRDCKKSSVWKVYYERMQAWFQEAAEALGNYPSAAEIARRDAVRFQEGVTLITNRTHPNIKSGEWQ